MSTSWIETYTGKKFYLLAPTLESIDIEDIAHALSQQCRFTGHTKKFYSVAEHSVHVSLLCGLERRDCLSGLLHDASEAYIADLSRPVKYETPVGEPYFVVENRIMSAIAERYGFDWPMPKVVKIADEIMLHTEKDQLMTSLSWDGMWGEPQILDSSMTPLVGYAPQAIEKIFLARFDELTTNVAQPT